MYIHIYMVYRSIYTLFTSLLLPFYKLYKYSRLITISYLSLVWSGYYKGLTLQMFEVKTCQIEFGNHVTIMTLYTSTVTGFITVVVCTDLWDKELHTQVGVGIVVTSGSLCGVMVAHWPRMPEMWFRVPLSAQYFPFSSHPRHYMDLVLPSMKQHMFNK